MKESKFHDLRDFFEAKQYYSLANVKHYVDNRCNSCKQPTVDENVT